MKLKNLLNFFIYFLLLFLLQSCSTKYINIEAKPGGKYFLPAKAKDYQINISGSGSKEAPFFIFGKNTILTGNSYIKISNSTSYVVLQDLTFKNNHINYNQSTSLIEVGDSKKSKISNILIDNVSFFFKNENFVDSDKDSQFHWINIFGSDVVVTNCSFEGKKNRLPIIYINSIFKNVVIKNNVFKNVSSRLGEALEAIRVGVIDGPSNAEIKDNLFENYFGDSETISVKASGVTIENNIFKNSRSGVSLRYSNNCKVVKNKFLNVVNPIRIAGEDHHIINNTFVEHRGHRTIVFMMGGKEYPSVKNVLIEGNYFSAPILINIIEVPNNNILPLDIKFKKNKVNGELITDKTIDKKSHLKKFTVDSVVRKDKLKVLTLKY